MSYKMCYVDADTALFRCAKSCQEDYIIVKHKTVNWEKEFRNVTEFYGTKRKTKDGGWIELENKNRAIKNKPPISYEMFDIFSYRDWETDRKSTRLNSSHSAKSRMPSSA